MKAHNKALLGTRHKWRVPRTLTLGAWIMKRIHTIVLMVLIALLLCGASYWLGYSTYHKVATSVREQYAFQQQRLLGAMRIVQLHNADDPVQLVKEAESSLFYALDGIAEIVDDLDPADSPCLVLWNILDKLEEDLQKHPLKHKKTDELMFKIEALRKHRKL
jgi:hypothetical protein